MCSKKALGVACEVSVTNAFGFVHLFSPCKSILCLRDVIIQSLADPWVVKGLFSQHCKIKVCCGKLKDIATIS